MARTKKAEATPADAANTRATSGGGETDNTARPASTARVTDETTTQTTAKQSTTSGAGLLRTIRENPVPAGLVWAGLGWLALAAAGVKRPAMGGGQEAAADVAAKAQGTMSQAATAAQTRARSAAGRARGAVRLARVTATGAASTARERSTSVALRARDSVSTLVTQKPEALELVAAAAGAAVALAVPPTKPERKLVDPRREQIIQKLNSAGEQAVDKVQQALE